MSFISLITKFVGDALKVDDWANVKGNFDDHESRITSNEAQASKIIAFDFDVALGSNSDTYTGFAYYKAIQSFTITTIEIQIFNKGVITSGSLEIDIKKNSSPDDTGMTSVMSSLPSIDFATDPDYSVSIGTLSVTEQDVAVDEFLRFDITSLPVGLGAFRLLVYGEV